MTNLSSTVDWIWYAHRDDITYSNEVYQARDFIIETILPRMEQLQWPITFVYDPVINTINIVFPRIALVEDPTIADIFKDAQFHEKKIPEADWQSSADLKEALLAGSNFNKEWH